MPRGAAVATQRFDAVVLDLVMPDVTGNEGVERMLATVGSVPILVLSFNAESKSGGAVAAARASPAICKRIAPVRN